MNDPQLEKTADIGEQALDSVKQLFIDADLAFIRKAQELGLGSVHAFVALISLHHAAAEEMEAKLMEIIGARVPTEKSSEEE